jgi:hypothetical protein
MPVIEAQCASILVPRDHRHINHERTLQSAAPRNQNDRICAAGSGSLDDPGPAFPAVGGLVPGFGDLAQMQPKDVDDIAASRRNPRRSPPAA